MKHKEIHEYKAPSIKFVKKSGMYCTTSWVDGKQKQEFTVDKPEIA